MVVKGNYVHYCKMITLIDVVDASSCYKLSLQAIEYRTCLQTLLRSWLTMTTCLSDVEEVVEYCLTYCPEMME